MLLKFVIIWTSIGQIIRLRNDINFSKHSVCLKWYKIFWNTLYYKYNITAKLSKYDHHFLQNGYTSKQHELRNILVINESMKI